MSRQTHGGRRRGCKLLKCKYDTFVQVAKFTRSKTTRLIDLMTNYAVDPGKKIETNLLCVEVVTGSDVIGPLAYKI